jgi:hypothetical protein
MYFSREENITDYWTNLFFIFHVQNQKRFESSMMNVTQISAHKFDLQLFVNIVFSYKKLYKSILSSVIKLT